MGLKNLIIHEPLKTYLGGGGYIGVTVLVIQTVCPSVLFHINKWVSFNETLQKYLLASKDV